MRCSLSTIILVTLGTLFTVGGNAGQLISLNFWLAAFEFGGGPFTVLTLVGVTVTLTYGTVLLGWSIAKRPDLRFVLTPQALGLIAGCGMCYSLNGVLLVYATNPFVPEILQAMLLSTGVFWTCVAAALAELIENGRATLKQIDRWILLAILAFCLCVAGVIVSAGSYDLGEMGAESRKWTTIFAMAQVPGAVYNVIAARYMLRFSRHGVTANQGVSATATGPTSDNTTVKLVLLVGSSFVQAVCLFCYFPLDWVNGFGSSPTRELAVQNFTEGYHCVFFGCASTNFGYYVAFAVSYAFTMVGLAILNHFSAPMSSMVQQLASPAAAVLLIAFPVLNANNSTYKLGDSIGSLVLLVSGSLIYVYWAQFRPAVAGRGTSYDSAYADEDENLIHDGNAYYAVDHFGGTKDKHGGIINPGDKL